MSPRTVEERPSHNPHQLRCRFGSCHRSFKNQSGLTNHIRSCHSGQASLARRQRSPPTTEARNTLPIHGTDESSSQGNPSTPLAVSRFSPSFPLEIDQITIDNNAGSSIRLPHQDGSFSPVHTFHGSPRESSPEVSTPGGDEPISKVFHPVINGLYMS
jgi:hypothetical protein